MREEELIKEYKTKLTYAWAKANTKSKKKRLVNDLCVLSVLCSTYPDIEKTLAWEKDRSLISLIEEFNIPFSKHVVDNKELYSKTFLKVIDDFEEVEFSFYRDFQKKFRRLTDDITNELICSFLNEFDDKLLKMYQNIIKEGKLFKTGSKRDFALIYTLYSINDNLIFSINNEDNNVYTSSVIVHELGHLFENSLYINTGNSHLINYANRYPYYEVSSRFLEYAYLNYLKRNNVLPGEVNMAMKNYYIDLFINAYNISILYKLENIYIDEHDCVSIKEENALEYSKELMNKFNVHSLEMLKGDMLDFRESFIYGIGDLFSIFLYKFYEKDSDYFMKEFKNTLLAYPYNGNISNFERLGISSDELLNTEEIKKKIKKI